MSNLPIAATGLMLMLAVPAAAPPVRAVVAQPALQQHVTIHVPRMTITTTTVIVRRDAGSALQERRAKECVNVERIQGFTFNAADSIDLVLEDGSLLRAKLGSDCPALGFYSGAYLRPTSDNRFCAGRDSLRSRSGRSCPVKAFKNLVRAR
jgi:glycine/D-amino acid oxidase-like deaminating enzyme